MAEVALVTSARMGSGLLAGMEAHQVPAAGSSRARRHMSTRGKSCATGSVSASVTVACVQLIKRPDVAGGSFALPAVENRALRYGSTVSVRICLSRGCDAEGQASTKDINLDTTAFRAGTCVKRIGLSERDSMAGRDSDMCGCAAQG